jgi:diguanylate cyclase (GGDEF)-like protein
VGGALVGVLVALGAAGLVASARQADMINESQRTTRAAEGYQEARFLALVQHAAHEEALAHPLDEQARRRHAHAAADFTGLLRGLHDTDESNASALDRILAQQARYVSLTRQFFDLTAAGDHDAAVELHETDLEPVEEGVLAAVAALAAVNRAATVEFTAQLERRTRAFQWGTQAALLLGLALFLVIGSFARAHYRTVARRAAHDELTGLANRASFRSRCAEVLRSVRQQGADPVVLLLDLDNFKQVNDTLGHHIGDELLVAVADRLATAARAGDTVARLGGDEFAILLPDGGRLASEQVAERIADVLRAPVCVDAVTLDVRASVGLAVMSADDDVAAWLRHADIAMYAAKKHQLGFAHYVPGEDDNTLSRLTLMHELRRALDGDEFVLHYQPKIDARTEQVTGVEALCRWQHPTRGLLHPDQFINAIELSNLSYPFTLMVIEKALAHTRSWYERGRPLPVAVNVSSRCLIDRRLPGAVAELLDRAGVSAAALCVEVTESSVMTDPDRALTVLTALRTLGVRTSIDDFGAGHSSMTHLKLLPVDELKIDRSFVMDMCADARNGMLVRAAIQLGHGFGLSVVAEGIEDDKTYAVLQDLGCDVAQGYHFARPLPPDALAQWLDSYGDPAVIPSHQDATAVR